jgi:glycosyltransferase involved in cell wall biosynthesis
MSARLSVITVCLNDLKGLRRTLASVEKQSSDDIEIVIIDGVSSDGTVEFLKEYESRYPLVWSSEPDKGIFDAMNKGIATATGEVVVFLNAADSFSDDEVARFVLDDWQKEGWDWGFGAVRVCDLDGELISGAVLAPFRQRRIELGVSYIPHQSMYIRREFFAQIGDHDLRFGIAADQEFAIRAAKVSAPRTWIRFIYHHARNKNDALFMGSNAADVAFTAGISGYRMLRDFARRVKSGPTPRE